MPGFALWLALPVPPKQMPSIFPRFLERSLFHFKDEGSQSLHKVILRYKNMTLFSSEIWTFVQTLSNFSGGGHNVHENIGRVYICIYIVISVKRERYHVQYLELLKKNYVRYFRGNPRSGSWHSRLNNTTQRGVWYVWEHIVKNIQQPLMNYTDPKIH